MSSSLGGAFSGFFATTRTVPVLGFGIGLGLSPLSPLLDAAIRPITTTTRMAVTKVKSIHGGEEALGSTTTTCTDSVWETSLSESNSLTVKYPAPFVPKALMVSFWLASRPTEKRLGRRLSTSHLSSWGML